MPNHSQRLSYFDSSVLIKRYVDEPESKFVDKIWVDDSNKIATSSLSYAEIFAAFYRLYREGVLSLKNLKLILIEFEQDWKGLVIIDFTSEVRDIVPQLIKKISLKGADLVQMACVAFLNARSVPVILYTTDARMKTAAQDLSIPLQDLPNCHT